MDQFSDTMSQMANQAFQTYANFAKIWTDAMTSMASAGLSAAPGTPFPDAARQVRGATFRTMANSMEDMMRTPQFLEMMRNSMDAMLTWRKQLDTWMTQGRQATQGTTREDVDTLMVTIRHMERRILDRMEDLGERLDEIEGRLASANHANGDSQDRPRRRPSSRRESAQME